MGVEIRWVVRRLDTAGQVHTLRPERTWALGAAPTSIAYWASDLEGAKAMCACHGGSYPVPIRVKKVAKKCYLVVTKDGNVIVGDTIGTVDQGLMTKSQALDIRGRSPATRVLCKVVLPPAKV